MREIKFRGRTPKGKWLYGDLQQWSNGDVYIGTQNETWTDDGFPHTDDYLSVTKVNENTVGQFTGLHDKSGKELYEGDIVHLDSWAPYAMQICFIEGAFCLANDKGEYLADIHYIQHGGINQCTILGNIHDNPELLKGGKS